MGRHPLQDVGKLCFHLAQPAAQFFNCEQFFFYGLIVFTYWEFSFVALMRNTLPSFASVKA